MNALMEAILNDDRASVEALLCADASLATRLIDRAKLYDSKICHNEATWRWTWNHGQCPPRQSELPSFSGV